MWLSSSDRRGRPELASAPGLRCIQAFDWPFELLIGKNGKIGMYCRTLTHDKIIFFANALTALVKVRRVVSLKKLPNSEVVLGQVCWKIDLTHIYLAIVPFYHLLHQLFVYDQSLTCCLTF